MNLVKVTSLLRDGKSSNKDMLIDLNRLTEPVFENINRDIVLNLNETSKLQSHVNQGINNVQYIAGITLASFTALNTQSIFTGNIISRDGKKPVISIVSFITSNIVGKIEEDPEGSKFLYEEQGGFTPVEYIISQSIADLETALS